MDHAGLSGRRLWVGIPGPSLDAATEAHLRALRPGGIVLFRRNLKSAASARELIAGLRELLDQDLHIAVDQEGGLVVRFLEDCTIFPGNMALGAAAFREPSMGEALAEEAARRAAEELFAMGFDVNLAPVLDLATRGTNPGLGIRSFGAWPELAARLGSATVRGLAAGGLAPCVKHFPGLGDAEVDSHLDLPRVRAFDEAGFEPFRAAVHAGAPLVMTSHVVYENLDSTCPATFSSVIVEQILRRQLGFKGLVITDDLEMGAMRQRFDWPSVILGAAAAGHDLLCICHDLSLQRQAFELLVERSEKGDERLGDSAAIAARLSAFSRSRGRADAPDPARAALLAEAIAGRAITVIEEGPSRLPLAPSESVAVLLPTLGCLTGVENPLRGESDARELIELLGPSATAFDLPNEPSEAEILAALQGARTKDVLLVVTTGARFLPAQAQLLCAAMAAHPRAIHIPLRNPFDLEMLPLPASLHAVVPYGYRSVQLRALVRALRGESKTYGRLPVKLHRTRRA